jgi:transcription antitermination factor NusG
MKVDSKEYVVGQQVKVIAGPLKGAIGTIVRMKGKEFLLVSVQYLGEACISIDKKDVDMWEPHSS